MEKRINTIAIEGIEPVACVDGRLVEDCAKCPKQGRDECYYVSGNYVNLLDLFEKSQRGG